MFWPGKFVLLGLLLSLSACSDTGSDGPDAGPSQVKQLQGEVFYRERILLPPGSELEIQLQDISRADAPADVLATVMIPIDSAPPYAFSLDYDPARIDSRMRYGLAARIESEGRLRFINMEYIDPFAEGPLKVLVRAVPPAPQESAMAITLTEVSWELVSLRGEAAPLGARGKALTLEFDGEGRVGGFGGCNGFNGSVEHDEGEGKLSVGLLASTMMACPEGMELERAYHAALGEVDAYRIDGQRLYLLSQGQEIAVYRAP